MGGMGDHFARKSLLLLRYAGNIKWKAQTKQTTILLRNAAYRCPLLRLLSINAKSILCLRAWIVWSRCDLDRGKCVPFKGHAAQYSILNDLPAGFTAYKNTSPCPPSVYRFIDSKVIWWNTSSSALNATLITLVPWLRSSQKKKQTILSIILLCENPEAVVLNPPSYISY